jgi:hypothetical protein
MSRSLTSAPFSLLRAFFNDPRWSMAAAAITPRWSDTAFMPASFPGLNLIGILHQGFTARGELEILHVSFAGIRVRKPLKIRERRVAKGYESTSVK